YPESHYGRDALVGVALFLSHLARKHMKCSQLRQEYPDYYISKNKIELSPVINVEKVLDELKHLYSQYEIIDIDGVKIHFDNEWVHLRKSNTEPIIRIYAESTDKTKASSLARQIMNAIDNIAGKH
ncbi:MAG TPA: phosphoglucosamine mutase, partial [Bacteroidales bacterium]|nr:phosphoglucosamine mutase [Bacteroidales bacterium]